MLKLSIITINYNNLDGLKKTVESVVNQTWKEFEYIVIDGGSTDGSAAYIESQKEKFDYWVSEKDSGIYNAMNKGIRVATGEYLLFLNSGDQLFSDTVLNENHNEIHTEDLVYFDLHVVDSKSTFIKNYPSQLSFSYFLKDTLPHPATFIKSTMFETTGFYDESLKIVSDWKFFIIGICKYNVSHKKIEITLSTFYLDGLSSYSSNIELINQEKQSVLQSNFKAFLNDYNHLGNYQTTISSFKKSRIMRTLVKLGFLNKY